MSGPSPPVMYILEYTPWAWKQFNVFETVLNEGQTTISTRWVVTQKENGTKARLVVRGFEECSEVQKDSPTVSKDSFRLFIILASSLEWKVASIDIKAAFLQGQDIERDVFIKPPKEVQCNSGEYLWKLKKTVYGLVDASRQWFLTIKDKLISLGCYQCKLDKAFFSWYDREMLAGMIIVHVDDFGYAGTDMFIKKVIKGIRDSYVISSECSECFQYVGLNIKHTVNGIILSQEHYAETINTIPVASSRRIQKHSLLSEHEKGALRSVIGQINWIANHTRPDLSFDVLQFSNCLVEPKVSDLVAINKTVRKLKNHSCQMLFSRLRDHDEFKLILYNDASFANLPDGVSSSGGRILFLADSSGNCCPTAWSSTKIKRVVKSSLSAEAHSLVDGLDASYCVSSLVSDVISRGKNKQVPVIALVDNLSLVQNVQSTTLVSEKRLRINIASIRESVERKEVYLQWIPREEQLADCLTKNGADSSQLIDAVTNGRKKIML